ncbi:signal recognition particle receptor subunit beta [Anaeramoeba ignava]|uniref:Signal recognition particle receptor subunit beta n=1 Tax=Anaeramoeba ignava TaxID=1746090 RepID=A0A9Q0LKG7_ANAIG|nr:signal recognition particle receptor subunit beta [Anaeramoeba ignava]
MSFLFILILLIIIIIIVGIIWWKFIHKGKKLKTIMILGLCEAGKTVLYYQLKDGIFVETQSSMKENETRTIKLKKKNKDEKESEKNKEVHLLDWPGHARLRGKLDQFYPILDAIIFVLDSSDTQLETITSTAEFIYQIFTDPKMNMSPIPFLFACNKSDLYTSYSPSKLKQIIQVEFNRIKDSKTDKIIQNQKSFNFDKAKFFNQWVSISAKDGKIDSVYDFLEKQLNL